MTATNYQAPSTASHYPKNESDTFAEIVMAILIFFLIGCSISVLVFIFSYAPDIPQVSVETLTIKNFNISSNSTTPGSLEARIIVQNHDSTHKLRYDHMQVDVLYKLVLISQTGILPFVQGIKNETFVDVTFGSFKAGISEWESINGDIRVFGMTNINVKMKARIRIASSHWWEKLEETKIVVDCPVVLVSDIANSNGGSLFGGSKPCTVQQTHLGLCI